MTTQTLTVHVRVTTVDAGCDACAAVLPDVPVDIASDWMRAHRQPALLGVNVRINGSPTRWVRRRRNAWPQH